MSWKKFSQPLFNKAYFTQLISRYLWLIYVPIAIYLGFVFLCAMLGIDISALAVLLFPYAVCIVPGTALLIFHSYTKKSEISHLLSIPMTRTQQFVSAYFAGLFLILCPLMLMCIVFSMSDFFSSSAIFVSGMLFLAVIYYSLSVLGCVLRGMVATQLMMMATVSFGPLMLYVLVNLCISSLALGNMDSQMNSHLLAVTCPLISGSNFIFNGHWNYWPIHIIETIFVVGLSLYLVKVRPFELSGQSNVFYHAQAYLMRPMLYLNSVYLIFYLCSLNFFESVSYDTKYYYQIVLLLAGTGMLVSFVFDIWFSEGLHDLLTFKNFQKSLVMMILACSLFLIPLWQMERSRTHYPKDMVSVSLVFPDHQYGFRVPVEDGSSDPYALTLTDIDQFLKYADSHRQYFVRDDYVNGDGAYTLNFSFLDEEEGYFETQAYYMMPEQIKGNAGFFMRKILMASRNQWEDAFCFADDSRYVQSDNGNLYLKEDLVETIQDSYLYTAPAGYFETAYRHVKEVDDNWNGTYSALSTRLMDAYLTSLTDSDFESWLNQVFAETTPALSASEMAEIEELAFNFQKEYHENKDYRISESQRSTFSSLETAEFAEVNYWKILSADDHEVEAVLPLSAGVGQEIELSSGVLLFEGDSVDLEYRVSFIKEEGYWTMMIHDLEEVEY